MPSLHVLFLELKPRPKRECRHVAIHRFIGDLLFAVAGCFDLCYLRLARNHCVLGYLYALAVDLELGEYTIELLCVVCSLRPHSIYATRMGRQSPGIQGRVGCNQE